MLFARKGKYFQQSPEGYNVSSSYDGATWKFTAWTPKIGWSRKILKVCDTADEARELCKQHFEKNK